VRQLSATLERQPVADAMADTSLTSIAELFREHARGLLGRARRVLGSQADAEDAVQEVMVLLLESPSVLGSVDRMAAWLYTLVRRRAIDILRAKTRRRRREGEDLVGELLDQTADIGAALENEELARVLADAIRELPEPLANAFTANAIEGVTFRELSERTGVPMGTLMARKKRATDRIRERLRREGLLTEAASRTGRKENHNASA
jgi:RNA polymerase sigma factor (sigma-70 family)